jgi:hypothetical protein
MCQVAVIGQHWFLEPVQALKTQMPGDLW